MRDCMDCGQLHAFHGSNGEASTFGACDSYRGPCTGAEWLEVAKDGDGNTADEDYLVCPYCGHPNETWEWCVDFDEGFECGNCERLFEAKRCHTIRYRARLFQETTRGSQSEDGRKSQ